jgi:hypothetical protein
MRHEQSWGVKLPQQRSLIRTDGNLDREAKLRLPAAQGGREPGSCGMVNLCEASINVVISVKRKLLIRLDQTVSGQVRGAPNSPSADDEPPAERRDLHHTPWSKACLPRQMRVGSTGQRLHAWNVVSPSSSRQGRPNCRRLQGKTVAACSAFTSWDSDS